MPRASCVPSSIAGSRGLLATRVEPDGLLRAIDASVEGARESSAPRGLSSNREGALRSVRQDAARGPDRPALVPRQSRERLENDQQRVVCLAIKLAGQRNADRTNPPERLHERFTSGRQHRW